MKRPLTTVVLLAALLVPAGPAHAKGVIAAKVCGADDCRAASEDQQRSLLLEGGAPTDPPSSSAGWYRVTVTVGDENARHHDRFDVAVLPRERLLRGAEGTWMPLSDEAAHAYAAAAAGLKPLPASRLRLRDAPESRGTIPAGDGFPWIIGVVLVVAALTGGALTPPARRLVARLVA